MALIANSSGSLHLRIGDLSMAGEARRAVLRLAAGLGFDDTSGGRAALIATELATNLARHARDGELAVRPLGDGAPSGLEIVALDRGPGIGDLPRAVSDGYSTAGSQGSGLGAVRRLATRFDIFSTPGRGTVARAELWQGEPGSEIYELGAVSSAHPMEPSSGDGWAARPSGGGLSLAIVDGLGHGPDAAMATREALDLFGSGPTDPEIALERMHRGMAHTRGAAVAIATIDVARREVRWASVGNVSACIYAAGLERHLAGHDGTIGHTARRLDERVYPWPGGAVLVAHTDGVGRPELGRHPGVLARHAGVIAAAVYIDARRPRDDATVVAVREARR